MRILAWLLVLLPTAADAQAVRINLQPIASGMSAPLYLTNAHDGSNRRFIVEQAGQISILQPGAAGRSPFLDIRSRVLSGDERGLLGLAFHPQFASNGRYFVDYTRRDDGATVIAEYRVSTGDAETRLLVIPQPYPNHNGGMIEFGPDGYLYIAMGDGGSANDPENRAQNLDELLGKILRIDVDHPSGGALYSSPPTNPFAGATPGRDEIFAYGLRNPFRFSFDRLTGLLYAGDVGQDQREEADIITNGGNYGWRVWEGTRCTNNGPAPCTAAGFLPPIAEYDHSTNGRCTIIGGYVYRGTQHTLPYGAYIYGDFCSGEIFMLYGGVQTVLLRQNLLISSFGEDESGELYVVDLKGTVYAITNPDWPTAPALPFNISNHGAFSFNTAAQSGLTTGYARIQAPNRIGNLGLPGGMAIFSYRQSGVLVSEASVPAAPLVSSGRIYVEFTGPVNTGIAIANPNPQPVTIDYSFTDTNVAGSFVIEANSQTALFLNDLLHAAMAFRGVFTFQSSLPVSAIALRSLLNQRGESLLTTLPVANLSASGSGALTVPQFADGGGWRTNVVLVNPTDGAITGDLRVFAGSGQPLAVTLNGVSGSVFNYSIAPRSATSFQSSGTGSSVASASVAINPTAGGKPSAFAIFQYASGGVTVSAATVPAVEGTSAWSMFAESGPNSGWLQSGVAVANVEDTATNFRFELHRFDGALVGQTDPISLPAHAQMALFLGQIPGLPPIGPGFQGVLRVATFNNASNTPRVAVTGLRGRYNERGDFLITTTSPIAEVYETATPELLFPHFAIGDSYDMQFVLFSDNGSSGTVSFFSAGGSPISLPLR
jgi:glucose/arabinose dehydrogenase